MGFGRDWFNKMSQELARKAEEQAKQQKEYQKAKDEIQKQIDTKKAEQTEQKRLISERQARQVRAAFRRPGFMEQQPSAVNAYSERLGG